MDLAIDKFDANRFGLITGSACSVLFPKRSAEVGQRTYAKQLATQMYFKYYDEVNTWQTDHGNFNEHEAFEYYQKNIDKTIEKGLFMANGYHGGTSDALCEKHGVDFKCPTTLQKWLDYLTDGIDDQQYHQCQMYMYLFEKESWQICAYLTETLKMGEMGLTYPVPHDKRMIVINVEKEQGWLEKLNIATHKIITMRDHFYKLLENQFGVKTI